jgi:LacI family transcriptional regulator
MLARGKRRIGFIGNYDHCQSFFERYLAFRNAMMMANVPAEDRFIICTNYSFEIADVLEDLTELPDLFICANDFVAIEAIQALKKLGKTVPEDVMLCGFDDSAESRIISPSLTTVHIHTQIMAYSAVHLLMTRIKEPSLDFRTVHTETELIYRDSTRL